MPRCEKTCKYNNGFGYCEKYDERILVSKNMAHYGLLLHPLEFLTLCYNPRDNDIRQLMEYAGKLKDDVSKNICEFYKKKGYITLKQRKFLLYKIFHCYEEKIKEESGYYFSQVED